MRHLNSSILFNLKINTCICFFHSWLIFLTFVCRLVAEAVWAELKQRSCSPPYAICRYLSSHAWKGHSQLWHSVRKSSEDTELWQLSGCVRLHGARLAQTKRPWNVVAVVVYPVYELICLSALCQCRIGAKSQTLASFQKNMEKLLLDITI